MPDTLAGRLGCYLVERFPANLVLLQVLIFSTSALYGRSITSSGSLDLAVRSFAGVVGIVGFFLLARVFDEYKDFDFDVEYLPDRPLPRGAISWSEIRLLGAAALVAQVAACLVVDGGIGPTSVWWSVAFGYLVLTRYEFFVRPWLRRHFVVNTVTHLPVYGLASVWAAQMGASPGWIGWSVVWLAGYRYAFTFGLDLWRKSHAPQDERDGVDSYTAIWGTTGASVATGVIALVTVGFAAVMLRTASVSAMVPLVVLAVLPIPILAALVAFARRPDRSTHRIRRSALAGTLVAVDVTLIISLVLGRGLG